MEEILVLLEALFQMEKVNMLFRAPGRDEAGSLLSPNTGMQQSLTHLWRRVWL